MLIGVGPKFDFLNMYNFLILFCFVCLFACFIFMFAIIHYTANWRVSIGRYFDKIQAPIFCHADGFFGGNGAE